MTCNFICSEGKLKLDLPGRSHPIGILYRPIVTNVSTFIYEMEAFIVRVPPNEPLIVLVNLNINALVKSKELIPFLPRNLRNQQRRILNEYRNKLREGFYFL